jgi:membrane-associated protein
VVREYVERSRGFFERHGAKTVVLARFVPFVRTLAPMLAGIGEMPAQTFLTFKRRGRARMGNRRQRCGYFLGKTVPNIDRYPLPIIALIIVISLIPPLLELRKQRRNKRAAP